MSDPLVDRLRNAHKWATAENDHFNPELGLEAANSIDRITAERDAAKAALGDLRHAVVLAIAFIGRDVETDRINKTATQIYTSLCKADAAARAALLSTPPVTSDDRVRNV